MKFKEHIESEMVSELTVVATKFGHTQQLRERVSAVVKKYVKKNKEWYEGEGK